MTARGARLVLALGLALILALPGCALTGMRRLPDDYRASREVPPPCDASPLPVVLDAAWAVGLGAQAGFLYAWIYPRLDRDEDRERNRVRDLTLIPVVALAVTHLVSAGIGTAEMRRCRAAQAVHGELLRGDPAASLLPGR